MQGNYDQSPVTTTLVVLMHGGQLSAPICVPLKSWEVGANASILQGIEVTGVVQVEGYQVDADGIKMVLEQILARLGKVEEKVDTLKEDVHKMDKRLDFVRYALVLVALLAIAAVAKQYFPAFVDALLK